MSSRVTVVIPVYNQEDLVLRALDSIPDHPGIEIIVIDDGSTDNTWEHILNYRNTHMDKNLVLLYNEKNLGVGLTVNKGIDNATGDYIVLLGSDDYFYPDKFLEVLNSIEDEDLIYFNLVINSGEVWRVLPETKQTFCGSVKFMKRSFIGDTRCPDKRVAEDYDFYCQLLKKNPVEKFSDIAVKHYNFPRCGSLIYEASRK